MKTCTYFYSFRFFILLLCWAFLSSTLLSAASREAVIEIYHGKTIDSLRYDVDGTPRTTILNTLPLKLPAGTVVKIVVKNANTYFYTYGIDTVHLQPRNDLPDLSSITDLLKPLLPKAKTSQDEINKSTEGNNSLSWQQGKTQNSISKNAFAIDVIIDYMRHLETLKASIDTAKVYIELSDIPESSKNIQNGQPSSLDQQQRKVKNLDKIEFGFNSPDLKADLENLHTAAKKSIDSFEENIKETNTVYMKILDLLQERGKLLLLTRDKLSNEFAAAKDRVELTVVVPKNGVDISLRIAPRDSSPKERTTEKKLLASVTPLYDRPLIELVPIALAVMPFNGTSSFSIVDSVVTKSSNTKINFGIGTMILFNLLPIADNQFNFGIGLGIGVSPTESPLLTEYLLGFSVSYIDKARLGFGVGWSYLPDHLKLPIEEGKPLPPDAGNLDDLIEKAYKPSFFITFSFPGLNLPL